MDGVSAYTIVTRSCAVFVTNPCPETIQICRMRTTTADVPPTERREHGRILSLMEIVTVVYNLATILIIKTVTLVNHLYSSEYDRISELPAVRYSYSTDGLE